MATVAAVAKAALEAAATARRRWRKALAARLRQVCGGLHARDSPGEMSRARGRAAGFESDPGSNKRGGGWEKPPTQSLPAGARGKEQGCSAQ